MKFRVFVLAVLTALLAIAISSVQLFSQAPQSAGQISQLIPAVNIDRGNQRLVAALQATVFWNDLVATQPMARARIALGDGSVLNVGSNSSLRVIQHDASAQQTQLELTYGRVRAKVVPLTRSGAAFQIHTKVATIGVVGTDFFLQQGEGTAPTPKVDVAVLPFTGASGVSLSDANTSALAQQLTTQLGQSGQMSSALISPAAGATAPLSSQSAAQSGQASNATIVVLPVIQQAQAKESTHGLGGLGGHFHIPGASSGQLKRVDAEVQIEVQMVRSADGSVLKSFDVDSKKGFNNVNVNVDGYSQNIGSADINNPNFQKSPLGQMLADAMSKVTAQVQSQASDALKAAASSTSAAPAFDNNVAKVLDFEGSVHFCNLQQQCVSVGPGMMSTIRNGQPPDPPHRAAASFVQEAQQTTDLGAAPPAAPTPVETAGTSPPPNMPAFQPGAPVSCSGPPTASPVEKVLTGNASALGGWDFASRPFAATMVITSKGRVTKMRYYAVPGAFRTEGTQNGNQMIGIMRLDCGVIWSVMPKQQAYMEINLGALAGGLAAGAPPSLASSSQNIASAARMPNVKIDRQQIGTEQVGQYMCDKYRITVTNDKGKSGTGTVWAARELNGFPVKWLDDQTGDNIVFSDINLGPQNPSLFQPPPGYRKMSLFGHQ
ncbi:MAG TPA: FecR domain-containing protein [Candidatus Acidoferrales bacterium]|nr:FecR domain-containing protein [Candidatus Acidoferrales bacterium]